MTDEKENLIDIDILKFDGDDTIHSITGDVLTQVTGKYYDGSRIFHHNGEWYLTYADSSNNPDLAYEISVAKWNPSGSYTQAARTDGYPSSKVYPSAWISEEVLPAGTFPDPENASRPCFC